MTGSQAYSVQLSELMEGDRQILFEWINNKELVEFNAYFKPVSWQNHNAWFDAIKTNDTVKIFGIRRMEDDKLIGSCQLFNLNILSQSAELQIRLGYFDEMGKGFGSQSVNLLLQYGFTKLNLQRIYLHVFEHNTRAYKTYLNAGFTEEGVLRRAAFIGDAFVNVKVMSILKEEYFK